MRLARFTRSPEGTGLRVREAPPPNWVSIPDHEASFLETYRRLYGRLMDHAERFLGRDDARDAFGDAMLALWRQWPGLLPEKRTDKYVFGVLHYCVHAKWRENNRLVSLDEAEVELDRQVADAFAGSDRADPRAEIVDETLAAMPPRRRLEEDATFRDLAAPLLLTWSVPTHLQRNPRPEGEWERDWEEFTKRAGFQQEPPAPKPPARGRRSWRYWGKLFGAGLIVYVLIAIFQPPIVRERNYHDVPNIGSWFPIGDRIYVNMAPGAKVRLDWEDIDGMKHVLLEGSARFRVDPLHSASLALRPFALLVETSAGSVNIGEGEVSVVAVADTTLVHALPLPASRRAEEPELRTAMAITTIGNTRSGVALFDDERARMVRGQRAQRALPNP